jgi:hypothetical protein
MTLCEIRIGRQVGRGVMLAADAIRPPHAYCWLLPGERQADAVRIEAGNE